MASKYTSEDDKSSSSDPLITLLPNPIVWILFWAIWVFVALNLYTNYGIIGIAVGIFAALAYLIYAYEQIQPDEQAVGMFQGRATNVCRSGPAFILKPLYSLPDKWRYSTKEQVIEAEPIDIVTAPRNYENNFHSSAITKNKFAVYFRWSSNKSGMHNAVKRAPNPHDMAGLKSYIGKIVNDIMRQVGGSKAWAEMVRMGYAVDRIQEELDGTGIIVTRVLNLNTTLPRTIGNTMTLPEEAMYKANAEVIIRKAIIALLADDKTGALAMKLEMMRTIRSSAAAGHMTDLGFPSQIYRAIESCLGGRPAEQTLDMTKAELNKSIEKAIRKVDLNSGK